MKLFVCIFDDARLMPHFLEHYAGFGITQFHFAAPPHLADYVESVSRDYDVVQYNDFDVAETVSGGISAVTGMREVSQGSDEWVVIVDLDEFVEFDRPVQQIVSDLEAEGANIARGIMYDRFAADGRPTPFDERSHLPSLYPVRARFIKNVMGGADVKGVLVRGHLAGHGAHHAFHGEKPYSKVLEISHYKWDDPSLRRVRQAYEMSRAAGQHWCDQYKRILDHYAKHGRFAWETFGGELVGPPTHRSPSSGTAPQPTVSKDGPAVSVLIAVYDGEKYLRWAIESVLGQTRGDFELLIVDDGSTDDTPEILGEYARRDDRVVIHRRPHAGRSAALNFGCRRARAELIARLDADDVALPARFERQLRFLETHDDVALLGGGALLVDEQGRIFGCDRVRTDEAEIRKALEDLNPFYHSNVVFRKRAVEAVGGYRPALEPSEDYDLWLRLAERCSVANLAEFVGKYRFSPQQESVERVESQAMRMAAARASARDRRERRRDRLERVTGIDAEALAALGVEAQELTETEVRLIAWYADHLLAAGELKAASSLWDMAVSRAENSSVSPSLRAEILRRAALCPKAMSHVA